MPQSLQNLINWLIESNSAVAFTGAGISTDSGIPDFRSPGGVWSRTQPIYFDEFLHSGEARLKYWQQKVESHVDIAAAKPNAAHSALAHWEQRGWLRGVITQNIDGLHQLAGSRHVLELHGTAREIACLGCDWRTDSETPVREFGRTGVVPGCPDCGGLIKHATISFGQQLPVEVLENAALWSREADLYLAIGSSLVVEPAASMPVIAKEHGARLVIITRDKTPLDGIADLVINASIGETFRELETALR